VTISFKGQSGSRGMLRNCSSGREKYICANLVGDTPYK